MAEMTDRERAAAAFIARCGWSDATRVTIAGDASNRGYERLTRPDGGTAILMDAPPERGEDVEPFVTMARFLRDQGLSAPEVFEVDPAGFLLLEDLGDDLFATLMARDPARQDPLYRASADVLLPLHRAPLPQLPLCDAAWLNGMTAPLFEWYAPQGDVSLEPRFAEAFDPLARELDESARVVILRDYHAQNLLWLPQRDGVAQVGLLDFQDALLGHPAYDLVSILQDARRDVDAGIEDRMIAHYLRGSSLAEGPFRRAYALLGVQRNLRILGIFARLALRDGKPGYLDLMPRVWRYVQRDLAHPDLAGLATALRPLPAPTAELLDRLRDRCRVTP